VCGDGAVRGVGGFEAMSEQTERAWAGGPLRRVGTGNGTPSRYICERCGELAVTGVRLDGGSWICASCERGLERRPRKQGHTFGKPFQPSPEKD
jgi:hypothetical protein